MKKDRTIRFVLHSLGAFCCLVVVVAGYLLGYVPRTENSDSIEIERSRVEHLSSSVPKVQTQNAKLAAECDALERELDLLKRGVPLLAQEHELLKSFSDLAESCDMKLLDFNPAPAGKEGELGVTSLQMGFRGDYDSTCRLLWAVDNMTRLHRISSVSLRLIDREKGVFEIRFEMRAFHGRLGSETLSQADAA